MNVKYATSAFSNDFQPYTFAFQTLRRIFSIFQHNQVCENAIYENITRITIQAIRKKEPYSLTNLIKKILHRPTIEKQNLYNRERIKRKGEKLKGFIRYTILLYFFSGFVNRPYML